MESTVKAESRSYPDPAPGPCLENAYGRVPLVLHSFQHLEFTTDIAEIYGVR